MKDYTDITGADQGLFNPLIPPFSFNGDGSGNPENLGRVSLLDDGDTTGTIRNIGGAAGGAYNTKLTIYPGTGETEVVYYREGYSGAHSDSDWSTERNEDIPPTEREKRDERNRRRSLRRTKEKIKGLALSNKWDWFVTFTLDKENVDRTDYDACRKKVRNQLRKMRRHYPELKYLANPEKHKKKGFHWHALVSGIPDSALTDSGVVKGGRKVYNIDKYTMGFTTATRIEEGDTGRASNYITKYITKELMQVTKGRHRYMRSEGLQEPIVVKRLLSDVDQRAYYFEHAKDMQYVNDVHLDHGDYHERIVYAHYQKLTEEEKKQKQQREIERMKERIRKDPWILRGIERRAP